MATHDRRLFAASFVSLVCLAACASAPGAAATPAVSPPAAACPAAWTTPPAVDASLAPPAGLHVVAHASASGTQNYKCASSADAGAAFAWTFAGPEATLTDCKGATFGRHFASDAGGPEWLATDGSFVIGKKAGSFASPIAGAVPWLLVQVTSTGSAGSLSTAQYVQRTETKGGSVPTPAPACDATHAGSVQKVPYSADYWFYGH